MTTASNSSSRKAPMIMFAFGLVVGIAGTVIVPSLVRPYLPEAIFGGADVVQGIVTGKRVETDRVLLTLPTAGGTLLATFTNDVGEIDLMINEGDSLVLEVGKYEPFVENPTIARVVTISSPLKNSTLPNTDSMTNPGNVPAAPDSAEMVVDSLAAVPDTSGI